MPDIPDGHYPEDTSQQGEDSQYSQNAWRSRVESIPVLDEAEQVTVTINLLREQYDSIMRLASSNGWKSEESLLMVLMSGLGYLDASLQIEGINRAGEVSEAVKRVDSLVQDVASYHSMYAVMKYKAFKMYKISQTLEFNVAGLRATERMWEEWAERMRREHAELQAEVLRLRSVMSEFTVSTLDDNGKTSSEHTLAEVLPFFIPALQKPVALSQQADWEKKPQLARVEEPEPVMNAHAETKIERRLSWWARLFRRKD